MTYDGGSPDYSGGHRPAAATNSPGASAGISVVGAVITVLGGVLLILGFTALDWFSIDGQGISFGDLHDAASGDTSGANHLAVAYFSWLGWVLLAFTLVVAIAANIRNPAVNAFRVLGIVLGAAGVALTFVALKVNDTESYSAYLKHAGPGFYLTVAGFVLAAIGSVLGSVRVGT